MEKVLERIKLYLALGLVFLLPITILPFFVDPYTTSKLIILGIGLSLILVIHGINLIKNNKIVYATGSFDLPLTILVLGYVASAILTRTNKMEAFLLPGTTSIAIGSFLVYFLLNNLNLTQKNHLKLMLLTSAALAALIQVVVSASLLNSSIPQLATLFPGNKAYLAGGMIPQIILFAVTLPIGLELIIATQDFAKKTFWSVITVIVGLALALLIVSALPGKPDAIVLPPLNTSISVVLDTLKESPIFGTGPGNYLSAFTKFKPIGYNATPLWQTRFTTANSFYLTIITETGLVGLLSLVLLFIKSVSLFKKIKINESQYVSFSIALLALLVLPANITTVFVFFILAALASSTRKNEVEVPAGLKFIPYLIAIPVFCAVAALGVFGYRAASAEAIFKTGLEAVTAGDGKKAYDSLKAAIVKNQYVDRYHIAYAQVNMALAQSMTQNKDLSDSDRQTITTLIQQAIREAKSAVLLNQTRSGNWELLGQIYQAVMPLAKGADQFTIEAYSAAISLDPVNPNLRIALGGVYYGLGKFDQAIDIFKLAVAAKPDLANAHYNLSAAYREKGEYQNAIAEMEAVLAILSKDSTDYKKAEDELVDLKKRVPTRETTQTSELTRPEKVKEAITPPLVLPQDTTPPTDN